MSTFIQRRTILFSLIMVLLTTSMSLIAQTYIGINADLGNEVSYSGDRAYFKKAPSLSGSVVLQVNENLSKGWAIQYAFNVGMLGFRVVSMVADTLSFYRGDFEPDPNYFTLYIGVGLQVAKQFQVKRRRLEVSVGGGVTNYLDYFGSGISSTQSIATQTGFENVFEYDAEMTTRSITAYVKTAVSMHLNRWMILALGYQHHFSPALTGRYEYYHMKNPPSGTLKVIQKGMTLTLLVRVGKKRVVG